MIQQAVSEFGIDLNESVLVGDKFTDIQAGNNAGVRTNIYLGKDKVGLDSEWNCNLVRSLNQVKCCL